MERKVGIIGAGISGLLACKYAISKGYNPIVFESRSTIGGVWIKTLEATKLQTPKQLYQFSDFPWPSSVETTFPNQNQLFSYIQSYAKHFDLLKHIKFNTKVVSIKYDCFNNEDILSWPLWGSNEGNKWVITMQDLTQPTRVNQVMQVDFVILCLGRFSDLPNIPKFPLGKGPEVFEGKVMHSMDYSNMENEDARNLIKGKRVTVAGFKKSALDIAMECSVANGVEFPCTMICRTPHWNVDESFTWKNLYLNRFSELLVHTPGEGPLINLLASLLSPLRWGLSKLVEREIKKKQPLEKFDMVPDYNFLQEMNSCMIVRTPKGFYNNVEKGSIDLKRSTNFSFYKEGVVLDDSSVGHPTQLIKSDLVIFANGFKGDQKLKDIFASPKFQECITDSFNETAPLYRECIHPRIPQLAVIGSTESIANLYTSELRCRWLFELLDGKFKLPSIEKLEKEVLKCEKVMKRYSGKYYKRSCIGAVHIWYNDQLCKDMGLNHKRKTGLLAEWFEPYGPMDYA
ncbi:probable flavin-containing monooxygenase 1 [Chenopodium quinoa]|uniref:probable flavin-containing monooxygenase 1 n=1 Tax=Chenopodium quinoa TaxID=63459 RepID=UPI000B78F1A8|nr:probable flavin-containing monooxygenase 1 [Chenopodium quinoa]